MPLLSSTPPAPQPPELPDTVRAAAAMVRLWDPDRPLTAAQRASVADLLDAAADLADAINRA